MNKDQHQVLDTLRRVQEFINRRSALLGSITGLNGRTQVDAAVAAVEELTNDQATANRYLAGEFNLQRTLLQRLVREHLVPVARFARATLADVPDFKALTPAVDQRRIGVLLDAARATATAVAKYEAAYTAGGFPADQAGQINALIDQIRASQAQRAGLRGGRVNATRAISGQLAKGMSGVKQLDAVIIKQFASAPGVLAEWRSMSRVNAKTGVARKPAGVTPAIGPEEGEATAA